MYEDEFSHSPNRILTVRKVFQLIILSCWYISVCFSILTFHFCQKSIIIDVAAVYILKYYFRMNISRLD